MIEVVALATALLALATLCVAVAILLTLRGRGAGAPSREEMAVMLRGETEHLRRAEDERARAARGELNDALRGLQKVTADAIRTLGEGIAARVAEIGANQKERLDNNALALRDLTDKNAAAQEALRGSVESRLDAMRGENTTKLDEMRRTVDERLQSTLEARLGESFTRVVEQLNRVHEGLGEMKSLASNVGDLKSVLTNVKVRGNYGEVQLELILEQMLAPHQYVRDASVTGTAERVEFAVRLPGAKAGEEVLLPIDAKFPRETFERLQEAGEAGQIDAVPLLRKQLEAQIRLSAKTICDKYVSPPATTDFAILFLPTEGLYAEVLRQPGLIDALQRDHKIAIAGPTTLSALLTALQMGFRTLAIEKRSSEVWQVLSAVRAEFDKYNSVVAGLGKQLNAAVNSVDRLGTRTRVLSRTLKKVDQLPDATEATPVLRLEWEDGAEEDAAEQSSSPGAALTREAG